MADGTVNVLARSGENLGSFSLEELVDMLNHDIAKLGRVVED
jgi:threonyl-tRNA synthetase